MYARKKITLPPQISTLIKRILQYGSVGLLGMAVDTVSYLCMNSLFGVEHRLARFVSYWLATTHNWFVNRHFTFKHARKDKPSKELLRFYITACGSFVINYGFYFFSTTYVPFFQTYPIVAFFIGIGLAFIYNFTMANVFVYKMPKETTQKQVG